MTRPTNAVKDRWNAKAYDDLRIRIPKGRRNDVEAFAKEHAESVNGLVNRLLREAMNVAEEEWKRSAEDAEGEA